jgi:hypothetical protein
MFTNIGGIICLLKVIDKAKNNACHFFLNFIIEHYFIVGNCLIIMQFLGLNVIYVGLSKYYFRLDRLS